MRSWSESRENVFNPPVINTKRLIIGNWTSSASRGIFPIFSEELFFEKSQGLQIGKSLIPCSASLLSDVGRNGNNNKDADDSTIQQVFVVVRDVSGGATVGAVGGGTVIFSRAVRTD